MFVTSLLPAHFNATDVVSLYLGRGGFEASLGQEDEELQDPDRWCSRQPLGQSFWQVLCQWVWNLRLRLGLVENPTPERTTIWADASPPSSQQVADAKEKISETEQCSSSKSPNQQSDETPRYGPMQVGKRWGQSMGKFAGSDFEILDDQTLRCPAGKILRPREHRPCRNGDLLLLFSAQRRDCLQCPLSEQCRPSGSSNQVGRRVSVRRQRLTTITPIHAETPPVVTSHPPNPHPVLWKDLPARALRKHLTRRLRRQTIHIQSVEPTDAPTSSSQALITRDQRAHRRLSCSDCLARNSLTSAMPTWKVILYGVPQAISQYLQHLTGRASPPMHT